MDGRTFKAATAAALILMGTGAVSTATGASAHPMSASRLCAMSDVSVAVSWHKVGTGLPGVHRYQARTARIETPQGVDVTLDGEIRARTPVNIRVAQDMVQVLLPEDAHTRLQNESGAL